MAINSREIAPILVTVVLLVLTLSVAFGESLLDVVQIKQSSIINYLNDMVDEELLTYTDTTGKGGHHRIYRIAFTEPEFKEHIAGRVISKLLKEYMKATNKALQLCNSGIHRIFKTLF